MPIFLEATCPTGTIENVRNVVAKIYYLLRNICGFVMLGGLIFTGIRILLSSNIPTKKNQYLNLLQDWLIGMVLLVLSHVLMTGIFYISDAIVDGLSTSLSYFGGLNFQCLKKIFSITNWKYSSLVIHTILLCYLVWMTVVFAISYFKRFFWVCVLVVFAPVFAVMYSFGQQTKQIYSRWMKEFCLTVFVQPFHVIIYSVLVGIPMRIVGDNWWTNSFDLFYALMAISMIRPAEKYMRQLFGMNNGVANIASYDSGKQDITNFAKSVAKVAKTAAAVVATVYTGGAAAGLMKGGAAMAGNAAASKAGSSAAGMLGDAGKGLDKAGDALSGAGDTLGKLGDGEGTNSPQWITEGWDQDSQGRYLNPYDDEWYTESELSSGTGTGLPESVDQDDFDSADIQALTKGITSGINGQVNNANSGSINASNVTINASSVNMEGSNLASAKNDETLQAEEEKNAIGAGTQKDAEDDGISFEGNSEISFWDAFAGNGGLEQIGTLANDLIDGHHSLAAGLYVDGTAPTGEWNANSQWRRQNIAEAGKKREENTTRKADNWANNKANISIMTENYIDEEREKAQKKYGKSKDADYIESVAQEQAKTKAKAALKDMSVYVKYGVTDVNMAYKLYENANNNGFKPDESIRNLAGYNKFNTNAGNVNNINVSNNYTGNNYTTVEQAIPNAKTYYDAGYTNVKDMAWVDYMAQKLNKTPDYAMAVDEALRKKGKGGKLTYNGKDAEMKKVINQINSHYGG